MGLMVDRICAVGRSSGQMTVEFVAALPVLLAVAAIYLVVVMLLEKLGRTVERRLAQSDRS